MWMRTARRDPLSKQRLADRAVGQDACDPPARVAITVRIAEPCDCRRERWIQSAMNGIADPIRIGRRIDDVSSPQPSPLSVTDVDARRAQCRRLHDPAGGVPDQCTSIAKKRPVLEMVDVTMQDRIRPHAAELLRHADDPLMAGIGVGKAEDDGPLDAIERIDESNGICGRIFLQCDGMDRDQQRRLVGFEADVATDRRDRRKIRPAEMIQRRGPDDMHAIGVLAQGTHSLGGRLMRHEMHMRQLGQRVTDLLVQRSFADLYGKEP